MRAEYQRADSGKDKDKSRGPRHGPPSRIDRAKRGCRCIMPSRVVNVR
jgi:hypothetical protein